jgi:hypothetical protein
MRTVTCVHVLEVRIRPNGLDFRACLAIVWRGLRVVGRVGDVAGQVLGLCGPAPVRYGLPVLAAARSRAVEVGPVVSVHC